MKQKKDLESLLHQLESFEKLAFDSNFTLSHVSETESIVNDIKFFKDKESYTYAAYFLYGQLKKLKQLDKYEILGEELLDLVENLPDYEKLAQISLDLSILKRSKGDYDNGYQLVKKALEIYNKLGDSVKYAICLNSMANYYFDKGEFDAALEHYYKSYENIKTQSSTEAYHIIKGNLALIYLTLNYYGKAKDLYSEDLEILKLEKNYVRYATCLQGICDIYLEENRPKLAYKYAKLALENIEKTENDRKKASVYLAYGNVMIAFQKYDDALTYFSKSREILDHTEHMGDRIRLEYSMGSLFLEIKDYSKAIDCLEMAKDAAIQIKQNVVLRKIYNDLFKAYEGAGDEHSAYVTLKLLTNLNDTMFNFSLQAKVNEVQVNFELERKELEYNKEREINEYKNNLFSYITHEFRTPLTLINTPIEMMRSETDIHVIKSRMSGVSSHITHMQHLLDQLLDINKIEEGKMPVMKKAGNISPLLWHIIHLFEPEMSDKNIDFVYDMPRKNIQAYFDTDKIEKIITNLLSNALKYTREGGRIIFNADFDKTSSNLVIEVRDNGVGIDMQYQEEIFNKFYRVPSNKDVKGSGLGLSFVKELVTLLNGKIELDSTINQGSKFTVLIPIERIEKLDRADKNSIELYDIHHKQQSILIVEDNYEILKLLKEVFNTKYKVYTAEHGRDALQKIQKHTPDLVLTDIMMPLMNGIELCDHIKKDETLSHIPVILLSAKSSMSDKIDGLGIGADAYITKPFNIQELEHVVENTLVQRKKIMDKFSTNVLNINNEDLVSADRVFLKKATDFVLENIENENLSVNDLAKHLNMSRFTLIRKFKKVNDSTPNFFIQKVRLEKAKELIKNKVANVTEIAFKVGFGSTTYFSYSFKKEFGLTPKEYYQSVES